MPAYISPARAVVWRRAHSPAARYPTTPIRRGSTLLEQLVALTLLAILLAVAVKSSNHLADRAATRSATRALADAFAATRDQAIATSLRTAIRISEQQGSVAIHRGGDTLTRLRLYDQFRVTLEATRDSMAYCFGAALLRKRSLHRGLAEYEVAKRGGRSLRTPPAGKVDDRLQPYL